MTISFPATHNGRDRRSHAQPGAVHWTNDQNPVMPALAELDIGGAVGIVEAAHWPELGDPDT